MARQTNYRDDGEGCCLNCGNDKDLHGKARECPEKHSTAPLWPVMDVGQMVTFYIRDDSGEVFGTVTLQNFVPESARAAAMLASIAEVAEAAKTAVIQGLIAQAAWDATVGSGNDSEEVAYEALYEALERDGTPAEKAAFKRAWNKCLQEMAQP